MEQNELQRLHETLIEILDYVTEVCEENGLTYFLSCGTALGAYRHKGFIPWDDDLDIAMPREDYDRLLVIMKNSSEKRYSIQYEENEKNYYLAYAKVRKNGTLFEESIAKGMYKNNGIFIDIFPLDYVEDINSISFKLKKYAISYVKHILRYTSYKGVYAKKSKIRHFAEHIICLPAYVLSKRMLLNKINKWSKGKCTRDTAKYIAQYSYGIKRMAMPKEFYFPIKKLSMCGKEYCAPNMIEDYLSVLYGPNYMELPPIEQRVNHLPEKLRFE